jgi:SAM-dependent methyltransferase
LGIDAGVHDFLACIIHCEVVASKRFACKMAECDRQRWNCKHAAEHTAPHPADLLTHIFASGFWQIDPGRSLDIATGKGQNAVFLAERGFEVVGIDISPLALVEARRLAKEKSVRVSWQQADLENVELAQAFYDVILNFNYLQRSLVPKIKKALKVGGHVIFETYLIDQQAIGHPKNPDYLLRHNELLDLFRDYRVLYYREGRCAQEGKGGFRAGILARKLA